MAGLLAASFKPAIPDCISRIAWFFSSSFFLASVEAKRQEIPTETERRVRNTFMVIYWFESRGTVLFVSSTELSNSMILWNLWEGFENGQKTRMMTHTSPKNEWESNRETRKNSKKCRVQPTQLELRERKHVEDSISNVRLCKNQSRNIVVWEIWKIDDDKIPDDSFEFDYGFRPQIAVNACRVILFPFSISKTLRCHTTNQLQR